MSLKMVARAGGKYHVYWDGVKEKTAHTTERKAIEKCGQIKMGDPGAEVYYTHDYVVDVELADPPAVITPPNTDGTVSNTNPPLPPGEVGEDFIDQITSMLPVPEGDPTMVSNWKEAIDLWTEQTRGSMLFFPVWAIMDGATQHIGVAWKGFILFFHKRHIRITWFNRGE